NFAGEIELMYDTGVRVFVEVGPNNVLTGLVGRILKERPHLAVASDIPARAGIVQLQHLLGQLAVAGLPVRLDRLLAGRAGDGVAPRAAQPIKPTTWLVNGGYARPAQQPRRRVTRVAAAAPVQAPAAPHLINGAAAAAPAVPTAPVATAMPIAIAAPVAAPVRVATSGRSQIMLQHQQLMQRFLATQQQVMLAYLRGAAPQPAQVAADAGFAMPVAMPPLAMPAAPARVELPMPVVTMPAPRPMPEIPAAVPAAVGLGRDGVVAALTALISERTGYPA